MNKKIRIFSLFLMAVVFLSSVAFVTPALESNASSLAHPFLLVNQSEYEELRSRASEEPWISMKATAISDAKNLVVNESDNYTNICMSISYIMDSCSLAYILDPDNKEVYIDKIMDTFKYFQGGVTSNIYDDLQKSNWTYAIPPSTAFFSAVLALDIIHPELTAEEIENVEGILQVFNKWYWDNEFSWNTALWGTRGIWTVYKNDTSHLEEVINGYLSSVIGYMSEDGVGLPGTGYGNARFNSDRHAKQHFMDVLSYTGLYDYYSNYRVKSFYEWLYGYGVTANKRMWVFGDSVFNNTIARRYSIYKAGKFSEDAAKYAGWILEGNPIANGRLLNYVLHDTNQPESAPAKSRIFYDGGAYLFEHSDNPNALRTVLWNTKRADGHSHKEVNAINAAAFGELLLVNSGYNYWASGALDFSWDYISNRAVSGNTALIDYKITNEYDPSVTNDHVYKYGAGISEGFVSDLLSYGSGDSGAALPNGKHIRNLVSISPDGENNGYWVLFDEITSNTPGKTAHIALHPPSTIYSVEYPDKEYKWTMNKITGTNVDLNIFLATEPVKADIQKGVIGSYGNSFVANYLFSTYDTNAGTGKKNIVTVLFPSNASVEKADMVSVSGSDYTGALIYLDEDTVDYALESSGSGIVKYDNCEFQGSAAMYRNDKQSTGFYFVRNGKSFSDGASKKQGFSSDGNVSVYMNGTSGSIVSKGSEVTFYSPGITGVNLDGEAANIIASGDGYLTISVPEGSFDVTLVNGGASFEVPPFDMPFSTGNISLQGNSKIIGNVGTNASESAVSLSGAASIEGDILASQGREYPMPDFPDFSDLENIEGTSEKAVFSYSDVDIKNELNVTIGNEDVVIAADSLKISGNGSINVNKTGDGKLILYVKDNIDIGGKGINVNGNPENVEIYYQGTRKFDLSANAALSGYIFSEKADIDINGNSKFAGSLVTGGEAVRVNGNAKANVALIYAPNADLSIEGNSSITGCTVSKTLSMSGDAKLIFSEDIDSGFVEGDSGIIPLPTPIVTPPAPTPTPLPISPIPTPTPDPSITTVDFRKTNQGDEVNQYTYSDGTPKVMYGADTMSWTVSGANTIYNNRPSDDSYVSFKFDGTSIELYTELATFGGIAAVSILDEDDNVVVEETMIDTYAAETVKGGLVYTSPDLPKGIYKLNVRPTGEVNPLSPHVYDGNEPPKTPYWSLNLFKVVVIDRPAVEPVEVTLNFSNLNQGQNINQYMYSNGTPSSLYGKPTTNWAVSGANTLYNDRGATDAFVAYKFKGTGVSVYANIAVFGGMLAISILDENDEVVIEEEIVDTYAAANASNMLIYTSPKLADGVYKVKMRPTGEVNPLNAYVNDGNEPPTTPYWSINLSNVVINSTAGE